MDLSKPPGVHFIPLREAADSLAGVYFLLSIFYRQGLVRGQPQPEPDQRSKQWKPLTNHHKTLVDSLTLLSSTNRLAKMAANLLPLAETDVRHPIPPNLLQEALSTAPFLVIPGTFNTRDLGLLSRNHPKIRPGFIYRTGALSSLQAYPSSQAHLRDTHNIRRIFDMRSQAEHTRGADPVIEGVEGVWLGADGVTEKEARVDLAPFVEGEGETGYVAMYLDVLRQYQGIIREVLRSVRDRPAEGILFHCTGEF